MKKAATEKQQNKPAQIIVKEPNIPIITLKHTKGHFSINNTMLGANFWCRAPFSSKL